MTKLILKNLSEEVRKFMTQEVNLDISKASLYTSNRLSEIGLEDYPNLLKETVSKYDIYWLASELSKNRRLKIRLIFLVICLLNRCKNGLYL